MGKIKDHYDTKGKQTNGISTTTNRVDQCIIQTIYDYTVRKNRSAYIRDK